MRCDFYINDRGLFIEGLGDSISGDLRSTMTVADIQAYAIKNVGFVGVRRVGNGYELRMRSRALTDETVVTLMTWLDEDAVGPVALTCYDEKTATWATRIVPSPAAAIGELSDDILDEHQLRDARILSRERDPSGLGPSHAFRTLLSHWTPQMTMPELWASTAFKALADRYLLFSYSHETNAATLKEIGPAKPDGIKDFLWPIVGKSVEHLPDFWYARASSHWLASVGRTGKPLVHDIDATVQWSGQRSTRLRYQRAIIPLSMGGKVYLLSGAIDDPSIDLRRLAS